MNDQKLENMPDGISEDVVVEILTRVSRRIARHKKYVFDGHEETDIVQRGIYEGLRAIANGLYNTKKGKGATPEDSLERFMSVHIRRRLANYKRDMMRKNNAGDGRGIMNPVSLTDFTAVDEEVPDHSGETIHREMVSKIKSALSCTPELLTDFYRLMDGSPLPSQRKVKIRQKVVEILKELEYGVEEED